MNHLQRWNEVESLCAKASQAASSMKDFSLPQDQRDDAVTVYSRALEEIHNNLSHLFLQGALADVPQVLSFVYGGDDA